MHPNQNVIQIYPVLFKPEQYIALFMSLQMIEKHLLLQFQLFLIDS